MDSNLEDNRFCTEWYQAFPNFNLLLISSWTEFWSVIVHPYHPYRCYFCEPSVSIFCQPRHTGRMTSARATHCWPVAEEVTWPLWVTEWRPKWRRKNVYSVSPAEILKLTNHSMPSACLFFPRLPLLPPDRRTRKHACCNNTNTYRVSLISCRFRS